MDPASVVGCTAAGLQFLSFTAKVAMGTWRAVGSVRDLPIKASDLHIAATRFGDTVNEMDKYLSSGNGSYSHQPSGMERILRSTCIDFREKAEQLRNATIALEEKLREGSRMESLWESLKKQLGVSLIETLTASLAESQQQLLNATVACLWEHSKQSQAAFAEMHMQITSLHETMAKLQQDESILISQIGLRTKPTGEPDRDAMLLVQDNLGRIDWQGRHLREVQAEIMEALKEERWTPKPLDDCQVASQLYKRCVGDTLKWLSFDAMGKRHDNISYPYESTMEWIWRHDPSPPVSALPYSTTSNFREWLQNESSRLYWITGKPGSGKSTMMRHIQEHSNLRPLLEQWSPGLPLRILSFYAWNPGADVEKSLEGLVRTILTQGLSELPALAPVVFPRRWAFMTTMLGSPYPQQWAHEDLKEIEEGLYRFLTASYGRIRLMVLIDGLDEFDVAPKRVIQIIERISHIGNVKLCVASRPWMEFQDFFAQFPHVAMDKMTEGDIEIYTKKRFTLVLASQDRLAEVEHLRAKVQQQAEGVFQWVVVVVNFLIDLLEQGDSLETLLGVVDGLPRELSDLYGKIWLRISPRLRQQAEDIFALKFASCDHELHFLTLWAVNERKTKKTGLLRETAKNTEHVRNIVSRTLNSRTLGLLEINSDGLVDYLHRTVAEWISEEDILASAHIQPYHALLHGLCVLGPYLANGSSYATIWRQKYFFDVLFCIAKIAADRTLADIKPAEVVSWLAKLERGIEPGIAESAILYYRLNEAPSVRDIPRCSFVQLIAACGFSPFVKFRIEQDRGLAGTDLFFFCLYPPLYGRCGKLNFMKAEISSRDLTLRMEAIRACLLHKVIPMRRPADPGKWYEESSLKDLAQDTRKLVDLFSSMDDGMLAAYYSEAADDMEASAKAGVVKAQGTRMKKLAKWLRYRLIKVKQGRGSK